MRIVDDGRKHFSQVIEPLGFDDEPRFAAMVAAIGVDLKGLAEDAEGRVVGVQGAVDHGRDEAFGIVAAESRHARKQAAAIPRRAAHGA